MNCDICNGTGKIPFRNKDGIIVEGVSIYCSCHEDEPEHYREERPEDYDFPMSTYAWRAICRDNGWPIPPKPEPPPQKEPYVPKPQVNITYQIDAHSTPAFKELDDKIHKVNERLSKYFAPKKELEDKQAYKNIR